MRKLQHPRGNTAANDPYIGLASQITVDTSRWEIRLHDAETPGGHRILNLNQLLQIFMSRDSEFGEVSFPEDGKGVLTRIGNKQYALRQLIGYNGIKVATAADGVTLNPKGTGFDFYIGVDAGLMSLARKLLLVASTGTATELLASLPAGFVDEDGAAFLLEFHVAPNSGAGLKLTINSEVGITRPLKTSRITANVNQVAGIGTIGLVVRRGNNYVLVATQSAAEVGISNISGMAATNVQAALAELFSGLGGDAASGIGSVLNFPTFNLVPSFSGGNYLMSITDGQWRLVYGYGESIPVAGTAAAGANPSLLGQGFRRANLKINGIDITSMPPNGVPTQVSESFIALGMVQRVVNNIYYWPLMEQRIEGLWTFGMPGASQFSTIPAGYRGNWHASNLYMATRRLYCGTVSGGTTITLGNSADGPNWKQYSAAGAVQ